MKDLLTKTCVLSGLVLAFGVLPFAANAGEEADKEKEKRIEEILKNPRVEYANEYESLGLKNDERKALGNFRYERGLRLLQDQIYKGIELTDLQKKAISAIVEDQLRYLHKTEGAPPTWDGRPRDALAEPGAENALLDPAAVTPDPRHTTPKSEIREDVRDRNRPPVTMFDDGSTLVNLIATELSGAQLEKYEQISSRWMALRPHGWADGPLRHIFRALRDPELKVSDEERTAMMGILRKSMSELRPKRAVLENRLKAFDETKAALIAKMSPAQRDHFEQTLKYLRHKHAEEVLMVMDMRAKKKAEAEAKAKAEKKAEKKP